MQAPGDAKAPGGLVILGDDDGLSACEGPIRVLRFGSGTAPERDRVFGGCPGELGAILPARPASG